MEFFADGKITAVIRKPVNVETSVVAFSDLTDKESIFPAYTYLVNAEMRGCC